MLSQSTQQGGLSRPPFFHPEESPGWRAKPGQGRPLDALPDTAKMASRSVRAQVAVGEAVYLLKN